MLTRKRGRDAHRTVFDARQRLASTTGTRASYDFELLREYANSRKSSLLVMSGLLLSMGIYAGFWVPVFAAISWSAAVIISNLAVVIMCSRFLAGGGNKGSVKNWTTSFIAAETVYGTAWATLALFTQASGGEDIAVVLFAILLMGIGANALASRSLPIAP